MARKPSLRIVAVLAVAMLAACVRDGGGGSGSSSGTIRFSVLSVASPQVLARGWNPILRDMESATGLKVQPYFSSNYRLLVDAMRNRRTDLGWFSNQSGLEAVRMANGEVFARTVDPDGQDGYNAVLIVGARSPITLEKVLRCDRTLSFGLGDVISTSGTLAPMTYLFAPRGLRPETCFRQVRRASFRANLTAVAEGTLDVATANTTSLLFNSREGRHEADRVKVIWKSPVLPEDPIIWRRDLDPAVKEKVRQFFITYGQGDSPAAATQRARLLKVDIGGFRPADNSHLLPVREMEATRVWLEARHGGDKARIAAAKAALDAITAQRVALEARTRAPAAAQ
jgi:phosphonate transport system substrate-binding protein